MDQFQYRRGVIWARGETSAGPLGERRVIGRKGRRKRKRGAFLRFNFRKLEKLELFRITYFEVFSDIELVIYTVSAKRH